MDAEVLTGEESLSIEDYFEMADLQRKERRENGVSEEPRMKAYMVSINGTHEIRIEAKTKAEAERRALDSWATARAELLPPDQWPTPVS